MAQAPITPALSTRRSASTAPRGERGAGRVRNGPSSRQRKWRTTSSTSSGKTPVTMPELPEVETVRAGLAEHASGHLITGIEVCAPRSIRRQLCGVEELAERVAVRLFSRDCRRGTYLWHRLMYC